MNNEKFEIKSYKDHRTVNKIGYLLGIFLFTFMAYTKYYDGEWEPITNLFVILVMVYTLRLFFPQVCFHKVFIEAKDNIINYQLSGFSFKTKTIFVSHIQDIIIFESAIFLKVSDLEIRLSLIPFSNELKEDIGVYFEELKKEIENA